jgi:hypothetical protein
VALDVEELLVEFRVGCMACSVLLDVVLGQWRIDARIDNTSTDRAIDVDLLLVATGTSAKC